MADDYLRLIPKDREHLPPKVKREEARRVAESLFPDAESVRWITGGSVNFIDPGHHLKRIACPSCGADVEDLWWRKAMKKAQRLRFTKLEVTTQCCSRETRLDDLVYEAPAGWSKFVLDIKNAGTGLEDTQKASLEQALGCELRAIESNY